MHDFQYDRDALGRLVITQATATSALNDPFKGLHSRAREELLFKRLTTAERQMMRAAKHLPHAQRRIVTHHLLTARRAKWEHEQAYLGREASRLRAQDIVDDENRRQSNWLNHQAREAEIKAAREPSSPPQSKPLVPERDPATYHQDQEARWAPDEDEMEI